jgi:3-hydroxyacyl-[acyl-carrier-protein] dehydratase
MSASLDAAALLRTLPHRHPFLLVDRITALEPGLSGVGRKCVSANEPFFPGHFPGDPLFPGVLIVEAMAQVAAVVALAAHPERAGAQAWLLGLDRVRFRKPVRPGDVLELHLTRTDLRRGMWFFHGEGRVDGQKVATADLVATLAGGAAVAGEDGLSTP